MGWAGVAEGLQSLCVPVRVCGRCVCACACARVGQRACFTCLLRDSVQDDALLSVLESGLLTAGPRGR